MDRKRFGLVSDGERRAPTPPPRSAPSSVEVVRVGPVLTSGLTTWSSSGEGALWPAGSEAPTGAARVDGCGEPWPRGRGAFHLGGRAGHKNCETRHTVLRKLELPSKASCLRIKRTLYTVRPRNRNFLFLEARFRPAPKFGPTDHTLRRLRLGLARGRRPGPRPVRIRYEA